MTVTDSHALTLVQNLYTAWTERDMEAFFAHVDDDIVYVLHLDPALIPMGGEHRGRAAFRAVLDQFNATFSYLRFNRSLFRQSGDVVSLRVHYSCLHKSSGQILSGSYTANITVRDRQIVRIEEFPDQGFVEAFFRLIAAPSTRTGEEMR